MVCRLPYAAVVSSRPVAPWLGLQCRRLVSVTDSLDRWLQGPAGPYCETGPASKGTRIKGKSKKKPRTGAKGIMKVAIEGCCHGELDNIYASVAEVERRDGIAIDLLVICGDFQAVRNKNDLGTMACPDKYKRMNTFYKYYAGKKTAPVPTIYIGGNHEASNYHHELFHGGWVCPNIYYLGFGAVVKFGGLRVAGLSGIFKGHDYKKGHFEAPPYDRSTQRSTYHIRDFDIARMLQVTPEPDIFVSHDWPQGIYHHGNVQQLIRKKSFLAQEIRDNSLGSPPLRTVLETIRPKYWFSAHLHVKFPAVYKHEKYQEEKECPVIDPLAASNPDELAACITKFLALDKCLPRRQFLQVIDVPATGPKVLEYDPEWLALVKKANSSMSLTHRPSTCFNAQSWKPSEEEVSAMEARCISRYGSLRVPENFVITAPPHPQNSTNRAAVEDNPQTVEFCDLCEIPLPYHSASTVGADASYVQPVWGPPPTVEANPEEVNIDSDEDEDLDVCACLTAINPEEVLLDDDDDVAVDGDAGVGKISPASNIVNPEETTDGCDDDGGSGVGDGASLAAAVGVSAMAMRGGDDDATKEAANPTPKRSKMDLPPPRSKLTLPPPKAS